MMNGFLAAALLRVTALLLLAFCTMFLLRSRTAALRHAVLFGALGGSLLLPALMLIVPAWRLPVLPPRVAAISSGDVASEGISPPAHSLRDDGFTQTLSATTIDRSQTIRVSGRELPLRSVQWIALLWMVGSISVLAWLILGHHRLRRIASKGWRLEDAEWTRVLIEESQNAGTTKTVRLLASPVVSTPLTWGSRNPVIMLPEDALDWAEEHRRVVLRHELAHVARNDALAQLSAGIACALYWFHPLVWAAERRLRAECERACDDRVVAAGTPGAVYASHLLEVARSARAFGGPGFLSVAMARPTQLERRLLAVLNESRRRNPLSTREWWATAGVLLVAMLSLSAFRPVARESASPVLRESATPVVQESASPVVYESASPVVRESTAPVLRESTPPAQKVLPVSTPSTAVAMDSMFQASVAVQPGGTLDLDLRTTGGGITISGWDESRVAVRGSLAGRNWRDTRVSLDPDGRGARLRTVYTGSSGSTSFSHRFEIRVPRRFNVHVSSAGGGISITGVTGDFTGTTGGGELTLENLRGTAHLATGGGSISARNSTLDGSVSTGGGVVNIEGVSGNLSGASGSGEVYTSKRSSRSKVTGGGIATGNTDGSGSDITVTTSPNAILSTGTTRTRTTSTGTTTILGDDDSDLRRHFGEDGIQRHRSGGDITLAAAPDGAHVTTGGGAVRIGASGGEVYASTGGGSITIGPAIGSVIASTGAGDIDVTFTGTGSHSADLTSGLGEVTLTLPANINATLVLESAFTNNLGHKTRIVSDWALPIVETTDWDESVGTPRKYVRARKVLGSGGAVIRVRTVNGNVVVRRANAGE